MPKERGHRPKWQPEAACLARNITMQDLIKRVELARGPGMQSFEELCITEFCGIAPITLRTYMAENPKSPIVTAITRARPGRTAYVKAKMSQIIDNDKHSYQGRMITWFLERFGGEEFREKTRVEMTGPEGGPMETIAVKARVSPRATKAADKIIRDATK